jgi:hypothetical protein
VKQSFVLKVTWMLCAWLVAFSGPSFTPENPAARRHLVFVSADVMGFGDVNCGGGTIAPTPNIDRLAREGTRFTRYYAASPICSPSLPLMFLAGGRYLIAAAPGR